MRFRSPFVCVGYGEKSKSCDASLGVFDQMRHKRWWPIWPLTSGGAAFMLRFFGAWDDGRAAEWLVFGNGGLASGGASLSAEAVGGDLHKATHLPRNSRRGCRLLTGRDVSD